jgi:hypothetical protein
MACTATWTIAKAGESGKPVPELLKMTPMH